MAVVRAAARDGLNVAHRDGAYLPNPLGLYEPDYRRIGPGWPRDYDGHALKVVVPYLGRLAVHAYRVAFMHRDAEEIRQSYRAAFPGDPTPTAQQIAIAVDEALRSLRNRRDVELKELRYVDVLADPQAALAGLNWPLDIAKAAAVIDPTLYRFRRERLAVGL